MLKDTLSRFGQSVTGGAVIIAVFSILSRVCGLFRDRLLAAHFGASMITDAYYAAFRLPDFVFQTLVLGALSSAFIPVFIKLYQRDKDDGFRLANAAVTILTMVMGGLALVMAIFAPALMRVIAPGFVASQKDLTISMTRVMLIGIVMFAASNVAGGVLQGLRRFFAFSLAPVFYNVGLILGILALVPLFGPLGLAWGVVVGAISHLIVQFIAAYRVGWRPSWNWGWKDEALRQVWRLMIPRTFGLAAAQVKEVIMLVIASGLAVGSISQLTWADNLRNVPTNIFGVPLAVATFPVLAHHIAANDIKTFVITMRNNLRRILFLVMPAAAALVVLRAQIIRVILGTGKFNWNDTYHTAQILGILSIALIADSIIALLARAFYAQEDTKTPVRLAVIGVVVSVGLALILAPSLGIEGIAIAISAAAFVQVIGLVLVLNRRLGILINNKLWHSFIIITVNAVLAALAMRLILEISQPLLATATFWGVLGQGLAAGAVGLAVYVALGLLTDCEDVELLKVFFRKYIAPIKLFFRKSG